MESVICPLCYKQDAETLFETRVNNSTFYLKKCRRCDITWTSPLDYGVADIYNRDQYYGVKKDKFIPVLQNIRDRLSRLRARKYLAMIPKSDRRPKVLDIGCAEGRFLQSFFKYGCECIGIEHQAYPRERFHNSDKISYMVGDIDSHKFDRESFDIIIMWHVMEHMDDPDKIMNIVINLLAPDGIFILAVPNFSCKEAKIFKQFWFHLDIPWHKYHFSEKTLRYLADKYPLRVIRISTFCIEQSIYGLLQSILNVLGFPKNELYELIKGNFQRRRSIYLILQILICISFFSPCFIYTILQVIVGNGSTLKFVFKKMEELHKFRL